MDSHKLQEGREKAGFTQMEAAKRLSVSQPYLSQLERGRRAIPARLAAKAARLYRLPATALPLEQERTQSRLRHPDQLARDLAALGYPGFSHLRGGRKANPAELLLDALSHDDLDVRLTEGLPWLLLAYSDLDWAWLVRETKLRNLQNRLGFLVATARALAPLDSPTHSRLSAAEQELERARLAVEGTLCRGLTEAEKRWFGARRTESARHWNLLTGMNPDDLRYAASA
jgi:transcriptional regulator with XRE-family HTH domain